MSVLKVPGARLYYQTQGSGPPLVLVPGANGDARVFDAVAERLAGYHTVISYDRRGFSRSVLDGAQDYDRRLETDADDVRRLIAHISDAPAIVFGSSSGGVVALELMARHPALVLTAVPYEPAAITLLPDAPQLLDFIASVYAIYRHGGIEPALEVFRERMFAESDLPIMSRATTSREPNDLAHANAAYWFERELRQYTEARIDTRALIAVASRIVPAAGRQSRGYPTYRASEELARRLGLQMTELPGGHVGYAARPAEFAQALLNAVQVASSAPSRGHSDSSRQRHE